MILESKNVLKTLLRILLVFVLLFIAYQVVKNGLFGDSMKELLLSFEGDASDSSYVGRMNQFDISIGLFNQNRFLGLGIGAIEYVCRFVHGQSAPIVDNDYLDILSDLGIIGMVIYYGFHIYLLIQYIFFYVKSDAVFIIRFCNIISDIFHLRYSIFHCNAFSAYL